MIKPTYRGDRLVAHLKLKAACCICGRAAYIRISRSVDNPPADYYPKHGTIISEYCRTHMPDDVIVAITTPQQKV